MLERPIGVDHNIQFCMVSGAQPRICRMAVNRVLISAPVSHAMDMCMVVLMLLESAEVLLKLVAYGPRRFWFLGSYDVGKTFEIDLCPI